MTHITQPELTHPPGPLLIGLEGLKVSSEELGWLRHPAVGGVVLFSRNFHDPDQLTSLTASIIDRSGRDLLICVDHEGGRVQRFRNGFTRLPALAILGKIFAESPDSAKDYAYRHGRVMATELLLCGVDLSFAPVLDMGKRSVVIGDRAFASDVNSITELSRSYIAGMHDAGMSATGKHFPGHGSAVADSHVADVCDPRPLEEIRESDLRPFAVLCDQLDAVMMAHVVYSQVDRRAAGYSTFWIQRVLRQQLKFSGTVFSDDLGMYAARVAGGLRERFYSSLAAGCDAALVCEPGDVRKLLANNDLEFSSPAIALAKLKGASAVAREQLDQVGEWCQWKKSIQQLE